MNTMRKKWMTLALAVAVLFASVAAVAEETPGVVFTSAPVDTLAPVVTPAPSDQPADAGLPADTGAQSATETPVQTDTAANTETPVQTDTPSDTQAPDESQMPAESATPAPEETAPTPTGELLDLTPEPADTPTPTVDLSGVSIDVRCISGAEVSFGDTITVAAAVYGLEGIDYSLQWQYGSGSEWHNQDGANSNSYSFALSKTNAAYQWRVVLTIAQ